MNERKRMKIELEYIFKKKGYKNKDIAKLLEINDSVFSRKMNGFVKFNESEKKKLLNIIPEIKNYPELLVKL